MTTPIADFVAAYAASDTARLHMPGHKGRGGRLSFAQDITEISGADALYAASGIIAESEQNAAALFGSAKTLYSVEGSSQCIRAMLFLASGGEAHPHFLAARNAHQAFLYGAALLDASVTWLPPGERASLCAADVPAEQLDAALKACAEAPNAVYITSPDYLGNTADIAALAEVSHRHGVPFLVDNAHGAYLKFLAGSRHPLDLGADGCCDSAHKTLPVLTGGAYLHIAARAPDYWRERAKDAMALFGSSSPSYLILASLDRCNAFLASTGPAEIRAAAARLTRLKKALTGEGWGVLESDPLRLTILAPEGMSGVSLAGRLRAAAMEPEYADGDHLVCMFTPANPEGDYVRLARALGTAPCAPKTPETLSSGLPEQVISIRAALFAASETVPVPAAVGRIAAAPSVACPPCIPLVMAGERITKETAALAERYGIRSLRVVR